LISVMLGASGWLRNIRSSHKSVYAGIYPENGNVLGQVNILSTDLPRRLLT
jgi:hypothetical protein